MTSKNREWSDGMDIVIEYAAKATALVAKEPDNDSLLYDKVKEFLYATGASKPFSAKNVQRLYNKVFSVRLSPNSHKFAQFTHLSVKHVMNRTSTKGPSMKSITIRWVSTSRGIVYGATLDKSPVIFLVLSHVFDRMSQRAFDNELTRMQAIGEFFWKTLQKGGTVFVNSECELMLFGEHGLFLGYGYKMEQGRLSPMAPEDMGKERHAAEGIAAVVLKTFVNDLFHWQEKKRQWMETKGGYNWKASLVTQTHVKGVSSKEDESKI